MGLELVAICQENYEDNRRTERQRKFRQNRLNEIKRQIVVGILVCMTIVVTACASNKEMSKAILNEGQLVSFESVYATTEDSGLTVVVDGGKADGHVFDVDPSVAKYCEQSTPVEVVMNTHNTDDVTKWEPIKVIVLK